MLSNRSRLILPAILGLTSALAGSVRADFTTDFEEFSASSQLSDQLLSSGVIFSSNSPFVAVVRLGSNHASSGVYGIGGVNSSGNLDYSVPIEAEFFLPDDPATLAVTDFVSVRGDLIGTSGLVILQAFDINGTLIATDTEPDNDPILAVSAVGIHSVRFLSESGSVAFDDFAFGTLRAAQAVPEPASLGLVGIGSLGLLGFGWHRRRAAGA